MAKSQNKNATLRQVHQQAANSRQQLIARALYLWQTDEELREACHTVIRSMPERLRKLQQARGGYIGY